MFLKAIVVGLLAVCFGGGHMTAFGKAGSEHLKSRDNDKK